MDDMEKKVKLVLKKILKKKVKRFPRMEPGCIIVYLAKLLLFIKDRGDTYYYTICKRGFCALEMTKIII
jgi:hypothetical protein